MRTSALDARVNPRIKSGDVHDEPESPALIYGRGASRRLQAFCQAFPNLGCFPPSFSKHSFGHFVEFQGVTSLQNSNLDSPNIFGSAVSSIGSLARPSQSGSMKQHENTLTLFCFSRKKNRREYFKGESRRRPRSNFPPAIGIGRTPLPHAREALKVARLIGAPLVSGIN
jgi:hypothetical protein